MISKVGFVSVREESEHDDTHLNSRSSEFSGNKPSSKVGIGSALLIYGGTVPVAPSDRLTTATSTDLQSCGKDLVRLAGYVDPQASIAFFSV